MQDIDDMEMGINDIQKQFNIADANVTVLSWASLNMDSDVVPTLLASIAIVGLIGNLAALILVLKTSAEKAHNLIFTIAVTDFSIMLFLLLCMEYPDRALICKTSKTLYHASIGFSSFTLIAFGAYSFLDEFGWHKEGNKITNKDKDDSAKRDAVVVVAFLWTLAVGAAVLTSAFSGHITQTYSTSADTTPCSPYNIEFGIFRLALCYAIPVTLVGFFLSFARRKGTFKVPSVSQISVAYSSYVLITVYAVWFYPAYVVALSTFTPDADIDRFWHSVSLAGYGLGVVCRFFIPVALYINSGEFRKDFERCVRLDSSALKARETDVYRRVDSAFS